MLLRCVIISCNCFLSKRKTPQIHVFTSHQYKTDLFLSCQNSEPCIAKTMGSARLNETGHREYLAPADEAVAAFVFTPLYIPKWFLSWSRIAFLIKIRAQLRCPVRQLMGREALCFWELLLMAKSCDWHGYQKTPPKSSQESLVLLLPRKWTYLLGTHFFCIYKSMLARSQKVIQA